MKYVFKSSGQYIGFIHRNSIFSRDNVYLGWIEGENIWDGLNGEYRGNIQETDGRFYVLRNAFTLNPLPKSTKSIPIAPALPAPPPNTIPIPLPIGYEDAF